MFSFDFVDGRIQVKPIDLTIAEFWDIWTYDKDPAKPLSNKMLLFVYYTCDITRTNPAVDIPRYEIDEWARRTVFRDPTYAFPKPQQKLVDAAVEQYLTMNRNLPRRALILFDEQNDAIMKAIGDQKVTEKNIEEKMNHMLKLEKIALARASLEKVVNAQSVGTGNKKNQKPPSPKEKGLIAYKGKIR